MDMFELMMLARQVKTRGEPKPEQAAPAPVIPLPDDAPPLVQRAMDKILTVIRESAQPVARRVLVQTIYKHRPEVTQAALHRLEAAGTIELVVVPPKNNNGGRSSVLVKLRQT